MKSDADLMAMACDGDEQAFGEVYLRHHAGLVATARGIAGNDADDAVQEGMLRAWQSACRFRGDAAVSSWLHRIVINASLDIVRRRHPDAPLIEEAVPAQERRRPGWLAEMVQIAKRSMPDEQLAAGMLIDVYGYSYDDAAKVLRVPPGTVKSRVMRGRIIMARKLAGL